MKSVHTSGKRKRAIARATLSKGTGKIRINNKLVDTIQPKIARMKISEPVILAGELGKKIDVNVKVMGGGAISQAEAARLAIARAIVEFSKEANKPNRSKPRAKRQKSYR